MILAAGLGTRLNELTSDKPKALVEFRGKTLLENAVEYLKKYGIREVVINIHHFADKVIEFVNSKQNFGINVKFSDERGQLLDTGGGIFNASEFLKGNEPFIVYNVDIICNIDLSKMIGIYKKEEPMALLCVRKRNSSRYLVFDSTNSLTGWQNVKTGESIKARNPIGDEYSLAFSGIHLINPDIFFVTKPKGRFSIIDTYLELAKDNRIAAYDHTETIWFDMGKAEDLDLAEKVIPYNIY